MLLSLWTMAQFALLTFAVALGTSLTLLPGEPLLIAAAGALALVPFAVAAVLAIRTAYARLPFAQPPKRVALAINDFAVAEDPGRPGSPRPRAPSRLMHPSPERAA